MKQILMAAMAALLIAGCGPQRSQDQIEEAIIDDLIFSPGGHGTGTGVGMAGKNVAVTSVTVTIPTTYTIIFKCQHGRFIVTGSDDRHRSLFLRFHKGERVDVKYAEWFKMHGSNKEVTGYDFIDAN